jgi:hypothetical protein
MPDDKPIPEVPKEAPPAALPTNDPVMAREACRRWGVWNDRPPGERYRPPYAIGTFD